MGCELTPSQFAEGPGDASDQDASQDELIGSANCESEDEDDSVRTESYDEHIESVRFLVDVYLIADKLLDPISANLVIDYLIDFVGSRKWTTDQATISHVYASTATGNPLRKLVLDWWLREVDQTWTRDYHRTEWGLPLEFLQDFIIKTCALRVRKLRETGVDVFLAPVVARTKNVYHQDDREKIESS